jgi:hypothetical protein
METTTVSPAKEKWMHTLVGREFTNGTTAEALEQFDFPTTRDEDWKYTRVARIANEEWKVASDAALYTKLSHNTDDLWWFFQARRKGTLIRRLSGLDTLNYIESTQEVGLWNNGNQDRNEVNLKALVGQYGNPLNF